MKFNANFVIHPHLVHFFELEYMICQFQNKQCFQFIITDTLQPLSKSIAHFLQYHLLILYKFYSFFFYKGEMLPLHMINNSQVFIIP